MSTIKADGIQASTGTNTDLTLAGKGTGVPDLAAGFKVGGSAGVPTASIRDDAVTLAKLAAGTDGELITWDASGDPAAVAVGTSTHVLTSNGAGAAPTFQAAAAGGAWNIIDTEVASTSASVILTGMDSTYACYVVKCSAVRVSTDNSALHFQIGNSGGILTGSDYSYALLKCGPPANNPLAAGNVDAFEFVPITASTIGNAATEGVSATIEINTALDTNAQISMLFKSYAIDSAQEPFFQTGGSTYTATAGQVTQCKLFPHLGTFTTGRFTLWGLAHA